MILGKPTVQGNVSSHKEEDLHGITWSEREIDDNVQL